jgi:hypothetical protein
MWILKYSYDLLILEKFICPKHDLNSLHTIRLENASTRLKKELVDAIPSLLLFWLMEASILMVVYNIDDSFCMK